MAFGETVHAPPQFKNLPRGAKRKESGKFANLLLLKKLELPSHEVKNDKQDLEDERKRVIEAYRKLKNRQKL